MYQQNVFIVLLLISGSLGEDRWIWSDHNRMHLKAGRSEAKQRVGIREYSYERAVREREPTTKRPTRGQPQNDDIDNYQDPKQQLTGTRNYPYGTPNAFHNGQLFGGIGYPQASFAGNGILFGPGGPTGVIGRSGGLFPNYGQNIGNHPTSAPDFGRGNLPEPQYPQEAGPIGNVGTPYINSGANHYLGGQGPYLGNPYGVDYLAGGFQYSQGQYHPIPTNGPQYTEGYGLAYTNSGYPIHQHVNGFNIFADKFHDVDDSSKRQFTIEGKSSNIEDNDSKYARSKVNDKVNKDLKKY